MNESVFTLAIVTSPLLLVNWLSCIPLLVLLITTTSPTENPWAVAVTVMVVPDLLILEIDLDSLLGTTNPSLAVLIASNNSSESFTNVCLSGLIVSIGVIKSSLVSPGAVCIRTSILPAGATLDLFVSGNLFIFNTLALTTGSKPSASPDILTIWSLLVLILRYGKSAS